VTEPAPVPHCDLCSAGVEVTVTPTFTPTITPTEMLHWVLSDHLGSTSTTANQDGSWSSTIQYTAFGEIRVTKNTTLTKYRYTGQLAQAELGLDYYVARWYDPMIGHFAQADTLIPEPGKASAFDRYSYTLNNPIRFIDPSGHDGGEPYSDLIQIAIDFFSQTANGAWTAPGDPFSISPYTNGADLVLTRVVNEQIEVLAVELKDVFRNVNLGTLGLSDKFQDYGGSIPRVLRSATRFLDSSDPQLKLNSELVTKASNLQNVLFTNAKGVSEKAMDQFNGVYTNARNGVECVKPIVVSTGASLMSKITTTIRVLSTAPIILVPVKLFKDFQYPSKREQVILRKLDRLERRNV
jgi:RHS repeat-associated protein